MNVGGKVARFAGHSPKKFLGLTAGSVVGWKYFVNDESLLEQATEVALGDDASKGLKEKGVTGGLKGLAFGAEGADKSIGENVVDGMVGEGAYNHISHAAGNAVDTVENGFHAAGQGIQNACQGAGQMIQGYQQQAIMPQQGGGLFSSLNPFDSVGQVASSFWSGGSGMSLAALIPAAFLMFGNFGWMGKIVCGLIAAVSFGLFSGNSRQAADGRQLAAAPVQAQEGSRLRDYSSETEGNDEDNGHVIYRPRR